MRWLWVSLFFLMLFWLSAVPVFTPASETWIWLVILAIVAAGLGLRRVTVRAFDRRWLLALIPLTIALWQIPFPFSFPVILISLAVVLLASVRVSPDLAWVGLPLGLVGVILSVQSVGFALLYILSSRVHVVPSLTPFVYGLARLFSPAVSLSEHEMVIPYVYDVFAFPTRLEDLGLIPLGLFVAAGLVVLVAARRSWKALVGFIGVAVGYSVFRYLLMVFLTVKSDTLGIFWFPEAMVLSYIPFLVFLVTIPWLNRAPNANTVGFSWPGSGRFAAALGLIAAGVIGVVGLFAFHDPGTPKQGRLLIDELHSDWEWTTQRYDTAWYGMKSGYNYYCLAEYLSHYYHVETTTDSLFPDILSAYDVVMLKTPTSPYSEREIEALVDFVHGGGGLWLLGDHTNVFGVSTYLNPICQRFGLRFRYDSTYDLRTRALSLYEPPAIFAHPVVAFLPPYLFATSCTIEAPFFSENMILGYALKAVGLDYSRTSFFPRKDTKNYSYGVFLQQGGVKYGKGRVAGFTDSTCFSNFFMFVPGKPELALATVEWLNRMNRFQWVNILLLALGLVALGGAGILLRTWAQSQQVTLGLCAGFLGLAIAVILYDGSVRRTYPLPKPHTDYVHVAFESEHSDVTLPTKGLTKDPEVSLHTFFVWTQRLGLFPSFETTLEDALAKGDAVVIADPAAPFRQEELDQVITFVSRGGQLLVLIGTPDGSYAPRQLLGALGVEMVTDEEDGADEVVTQAAASGEVDKGLPYIVNMDGDRIVQSVNPAGLKGGTPLLLLEDGQPVLVEIRIGRGRAFIFGDFHLFTDWSMGQTSRVPDARERRIYELEYWMLGELAGKPQPIPGQDIEPGS